MNTSLSNVKKIPIMGSDLFVDTTLEFDFDLLLLNMSANDESKDRKDIFDRIEKIWDDHEADNEKGNSRSDHLKTTNVKEDDDEEEKPADASNSKDDSTGHDVLSKETKSEKLIVDIKLLVDDSKCSELDAKSKQDRNRGRRQQNKEVLKDMSHIPSRMLDPSLCKDRVNGDPTLPSRQRYTALQALAKVKIPDERKRNPGTVSVYKDKDHNVPDFNTREDNEMHDNICANFDENNKAETTSNTRVENKTSILSEMNDVIADDCIAISEDNTSDIATSFFSRPEAGCDEPS